MVCTFTSSQGPWLGSHELIRVVTVLRGTTSERMKALRAVSRYLTFTSTLAHHPSSYSSSRGSGRSRKMTKLATAPCHRLLERPGRVATAYECSLPQPPSYRRRKPTPTRRGWDEGEEGEEIAKHFEWILNFKKGGTEMRAREPVSLE